MPYSTSTIESFLKHIIKEATWSALTGLWVGLVDGDPGATGSNIGTTSVEETANGYLREQIDEVAVSVWAVVSGSPVATDQDITFDTATTANWVSGNQLDYVILTQVGTPLNSVTSANFVGYDDVSTPRAVLVDDTAKILTGNLTLALT